jgi:hypothetical protein
MDNETYTERLLRERPTHTKGGRPVEIVHSHGKVYVHTASGSVYVSSDFPQLFGWPRTGRRKAKAPMTLNHKGYKYLRLPIKVAR